MAVLSAIIVIVICYCCACAVRSPIVSVHSFYTTIALSRAWWQYRRYSRGTVAVGYGENAGCGSDNG